MYNLYNSVFVNFVSFVIFGFVDFLYTYIYIYYMCRSVTRVGLLPHGMMPSRKHLLGVRKALSATDSARGKVLAAVFAKLSSRCSNTSEVTAPSRCSWTCRRILSNTKKTQKSKIYQIYKNYKKWIIQIIHVTK